MDHSIFGYLSRRNTEELKQIIALCQTEPDSEYYAEIESLAKVLLTAQLSEEQ